jgi:nucleotide-binding universal stress UspA family protein
MDASRNGIVVGVTGPGENTSALSWAAVEATDTGARVTLVRAVNPLLAPPPPSVLTASAPMLDACRELLDGTVEEYTRITGLECSPVLLKGSPAEVLTGLSEDAELVVLAHRDLTALRRIVTWSTTISVAAHAACPVVAVPQHWPLAEPASTDATWVTVGVHETGTPEAVLEAGFEAAARRGRRLRLVHAWRSEAQYDDVVLRRVDPGWRERLEHEIATSVGPIAAKHPDVDVDVVVEHEWPADALAALTRTSSLLIVGRHGHHQPLPSRIGSIARTLVGLAECPVMVVPVGPPDGRDRPAR